MNDNKNYPSFECVLDYIAAILDRAVGGYMQEIQGYLCMWFAIPFLTTLNLQAFPLFIGKQHADISLFLWLNSSEYSHSKKSNPCNHDSPKINFTGFPKNYLVI